ncbi:MAG: (2Fe-2S)-binding protein, partial [Marivirga sp.]|nr:(2Fe-2S)-binding protein [Marivirga sp.]
EDKSITTIEGIGTDKLHPLQEAWIDFQVPQCGYCQGGQIMSAISMLSQKSTPSDQDIDQGMSGNLCRCGTYDRVKKAIKSISKTL